MLDSVQFGPLRSENCLGSSLNQIQGRTTVRESYSCALEQGPLVGEPLVGDADVDHLAVGAEQGVQAICQVGLGVRDIFI